MRQSFPTLVTASAEMQNPNTRQQRPPATWCLWGAWECVPSDSSLIDEQNSCRKVLKNDFYIISDTFLLQKSKF